MTTITPWPDLAWQLILLASVEMALDGSVTTEWLMKETRCQHEERMMSPLPETVPCTGWTFAPEDWDILLPPLESGDMEGVDAGIESIIKNRIRRRYSPGRIRGRLRGFVSSGK